MSDAPPPKPDRNLAIDAVKGIGILQVVVHHALGQDARLYSTKGDAAWTAMRAVAWATNFAIPLFLLLSAMLLAGSLAKSPDVGRFVWRRTSRTLWPYLVWTLIYLGRALRGATRPSGTTSTAGLRGSAREGVLSPVLHGDPAPALAGGAVRGGAREADANRVRDDPRGLGPAPVRCVRPSKGDRPLADARDDALLVRPVAPRGRLDRPEPRPMDRGVAALVARAGPRRLRRRRAFSL